VLFLFSASCANQNSFSNDKARFGGPPGAPAVDPNNPEATSIVAFQRASAVLGAKCAGCHGWASKTYEQWKASSGGKMLKPGDPDCSNVFFRIKGSGAVCRTLKGEHDMPDEGSISPDDLKKIREWILAMPKPVADTTAAVMLDDERSELEPL
jgi:hypothetical protein